MVRRWDIDLEMHRVERSDRYFHHRRGNRLSWGQLIQFITNGILEKGILSTDPQVMGKYHHVTVDEIHDGAIMNEVMLPLLREYFLSRYEQDGRLRITARSATINPHEYIKYFQQGAKRGPSLFKLIGDTPFEITPHYLPLDCPLSKRAAGAAHLALIIHFRKPLRPLGNTILSVFPGRGDIQEVETVLHKAQEPIKIERATGGGGSMSNLTRLDAIDGHRTIILATNAAETSITVPDAGYVLDTGVYNQLVYDYKTRSSELKTRVISKSQADQRRGRVGRTCDGEYFALYAKSDYPGMERTQRPAITTENITPTILRLCAYGRDPRYFPWLHPPTQEQLEGAFNEMMYHKAADETGTLTGTGYLICSTGLDIIPASFVVSAYGHGSRETRVMAINIAVMLEEYESLFITKSAANIRNVLPRIEKGVGDHKKLGLILDEFIRRGKRKD